MWKCISALAVIILLINPHYHVVRRKKPNMNIYLKLIKLKKIIPPMIIEQNILKIAA